MESLSKCLIINTQKSINQNRLLPNLTIVKLSSSRIVDNQLLIARSGA